MKATNAKALWETLGEALSPVIVGQEALQRQLLCALLCQGHVLLEGVPGVGKTLLARAFAACLSLDFARVQFTPDLMPADISGTPVLVPGEARFELSRGPLFTELLLADEINRTPPKTQAALLEAMEERQVTLGDTSYPLGPNFFVIATSNPLEFEGTYPLPEAQTDRFLMKLVMQPPTEEELQCLLQRHHEGFRPNDLSALSPLVDGDQLQAIRAEVAALHVEPSLFRYIAALIQATAKAPTLRYGASPRAGIALLQVAKAHAAISGEDYLSPDQVKGLAPAVLRHRLQLEADAEIAGLAIEEVIASLLDEVEIPR